jgi:hypothetical protein
MKIFLNLLNSYKETILIILGFIVLVIIATNIKNKPIENNSKQVDSLQLIIDRLEIDIYKRDMKIDSLYNKKQIINNTYETTIENYNNPTIVSDDSISRYISNKLQNRK